MNIRKLLHVFRKPKDTPEALISKIDQQLAFKKSEALTMGIECEFGLVKTDGYQPSPIALDIIKTLNNAQIHHEGRQHTIEITTGVCKTIQQAEQELTTYKNDIDGLLAPYQTSMLGMGSLPLLTLDQTVAVDLERYQNLREKRKILRERFSITMGMHVHIGMEDAASCIRFHNFYMHFLPHILAMSANSPFEGGQDTGLQSIRPTITEAMPIAGLPYQFKNWNDYKDLCIGMATAGSIDDLKDLWWDLRPCPRYGTLEIRISDQPATLKEVLAIAAFIQCLGLWFEEHQSWLDEMPRPSSWRMRDNKWRAMRYGIKADMILNNAGATKPIKDDIKQWIERLQPFYDRLNYDVYRRTLLDILERGTGAARQRRVWNATGSLQAVYAHAIEELRHGAPLWDRIDELEKNASNAHTPTDIPAPRTGPVISMTDEEWFDPANKGCCA